MPNEMSITEVAENIVLAKGFVTSRPDLYKALSIAYSIMSKVALGELVKLPTQFDTCNIHVGEKIDVVTFLKTLQWKLMHDEDFTLEDISEIELWCLTDAIEVEKLFRSGELVKKAESEKLPQWKKDAYNEMFADGCSNVKPMKKDDGKA